MLMIDLVCSQTDSRTAVMGQFSLIAQSHKVYAEIIQTLQNTGLASIPVLSQIHLSTFFPVFFFLWETDKAISPF